MCGVIGKNSQKDETTEWLQVCIRKIISNGDQIGYKIYGSWTSIFRFEMRNLEFRIWNLKGISFDVVPARISETGKPDGGESPMSFEGSVDESVSPTLSTFRRVSS